MEERPPYAKVDAIASPPLSRSERIKNLLFVPFAISPIIQRFALPGLIGFALAAIGYWQQINWLIVVGVTLATPVLWAYAVLLLIYIPLLLISGVWRRLTK